MTGTRTRAMLAARAKDSHDKRDRVLAAIRALEAAGTPVTATAVATAAGVSTWLVYADGVREQLHAARQRQAQHDPAPCPARPAGSELVTPGEHFRRVSDRGGTRLYALVYVLRVTVSRV